MILETISALMQLAKFPKLSREQRRQREELFRDLKRAGFKNEEILPFAGSLTIGRVKQITNKVAVVNTEEKDDLFKAMTQLIASNQTVDDVKKFNKEKKILDDRHETIETLIKLSDSIHSKDSDITTLQKFMEEMGDLTVPKLKEYHEIFLTLEKQGWAEIEYEFAAEILRRSPHIKVIEFLELYNDTNKKLDILKEIKNQINSAQNDLDKKNTEIKALEVKKLYIKNLNDYTERLVIEYQFTLDAFLTLNKVASKYGKAIDVIEAVNKYNNLTELTSELQVKTKLLESKVKEIEEAKIEYEKTLVRFAEIFKLTGEIQSQYRSIRTFNNLANMVSESVDTNLETAEFAWTSYFALYAVSNYIDHHGELPSTYVGTQNKLRSLLKEFESQLK